MTRDRDVRVSRRPRTTPSAADVGVSARASARRGPTAETEARWAAERERLLELLAQQQRVAQAGLVTAGLIHDVNNHLANISGAAYLALQSNRGDDWRAALDRVQGQCTTLAETMRSFLSFVRRRDEDDARCFALSEAVEQARQLAAPLARDHSVTVRVELAEEGEVEGNLRLAVQTLVNLASNAIRACASNGGEVVLAASRPESITCRLEVRDTGPGIPEAIRRLIFRPFATQSGAAGHGLGLFIVRQAVRRMNGRIRVRTSPRGTTFTLDLPSA